MKLIIDIPNSLYANLKKIANGSIASKRILDCVKNGTPLPKGHGRLIDADELDTRLLQKGFAYAMTRRRLRYTIGEVRQKIADEPTIIKADKEADNDK